MDANEPIRHGPETLRYVARVRRELSNVATTDRDRAWWGAALRNNLLLQSQAAWITKHHPELVPFLRYSRSVSAARVLDWRLDEITAECELIAGSLEVPSDGRTDEFKPNSDFTEVLWGGERFRFSKGQQAESFHVLWDAYQAGLSKTQSGGFGLSEKTIGDRIGSNASNFRLFDVFRSRDGQTGQKNTHPAWKTMIQPAGKGRFRLRAPQNPQ